MNQTDRARVYIAKLPHAISGNGGHAATLLAACRLVEFGLTWPDAWRLLVEWNKTHCEPQWSERELTHKLKDAFQRTEPDPRFLNRADSGAAVQSAKHGATASQAATPKPAMTPAHTVTVFPPPTSQAQPVKAPYRPTGSEVLPGLRPQLSKLALVAESRAQMVALARLRGLSIKAVALASERGLLRFGRYRGQSAWFILDDSQRVAQARRLDGCPWTIHSLARAVESPVNLVTDHAKALNLPGSDPRWPVGILAAVDFPSVALCEGGADLLAAFHFLIEQGRAADCAPVAVLGWGPPIHADALPLFAGKRVRIFPHLDKAGSQAAARWTAQLTQAGAAVDSFRFQEFQRERGQVTDLNDLAHMAPQCHTPLFP
jgi:hypothetical protein